MRILVAERAIDSVATSGRPFKIPIGVREAIRGRLDSLSAEVNLLLATAAAIGKEFDSSLCQSVAKVPDDQAHRLLEEASRADIVTELGRGRYRFSHALIHDVRYEELENEGRVRVHSKVGNQLEELNKGNLEPHLAELAHHFREAA